MSRFVAANFSKPTLMLLPHARRQLTVQEISTMLRHGLKPIIVVLNNDGCSSFVSSGVGERLGHR